MCLFILKLNYQLSLKTSFQNKYLIFSFILSVLVFFLPLNIPQFRMENWNNIKKVEKSYTKICLLKIGWIYQLHQIKTFSNVTSIKTTTKKIKTNNTNNTFNIQKCIMVTRPQVVDVSLLRLSPTVEVCAIAPRKGQTPFCQIRLFGMAEGQKKNNRTRPSSIYVPARSNEAMWRGSLTKPYRQARGLWSPGRTRGLFTWCRAWLAGHSFGFKVFPGR